MREIRKYVAVIMVHPVGFEPTTNGFEDRYSSNWAMGASYPTTGASEADYREL